MPSWTEAYEDVTQAPSDEEREQGRERELLEVAVRALARGADISRGQPGDGRCARHRIRHCQCERKAT